MRYKLLIGSVEYSYTRYFYAFSDTPSRAQQGQRAAGGALDILHGVFLSAGVAY